MLNVGSLNWIINFKCWNVKLKVGCYNLMLAGQVECWGLKLIFGSLSWIINFECCNVKLKVECYNLTLAGQVEWWGLKLIFGSLSWIINFECWNVKLKVECYNLMLAGQVECWRLKLISGGNWTPYVWHLRVGERGLMNWGRTFDWLPEVWLHLFQLSCFFRSVRSLFQP